MKMPTRMEQKLIWSITNLRLTPGIGFRKHFNLKRQSNLTFSVFKLEHTNPKNKSNSFVNLYGLLEKSILGSYQINNVQLIYLY